MRKNNYGTWNWNYETHQKATGFFKVFFNFFNFYIKCLPLIFFHCYFSNYETFKYFTQFYSLNYSIWTLDIISAYEQISDVPNKFELLRINIDVEFYTLFKEVVKLLFVKMNTQTARSSF